MGYGAEYLYGPVTDYSIKTNMSADAGRGWVWGVNGVVPIAALNTQGNMQIAGTFTAAKLQVNADNSFIAIDAQSNPRLGIIKKFGGFPVIASDNVSPIIFAQTNQSGVNTNIAGATVTERMRVDVNGNVGIGTSSPANWFSGKVLEMSDVRPTLKLTSTSSTGLGTVVFTNSGVNATSHNGEFHMNHQFDPANNDKSLIRFSGYPTGDILALQANGNVGVGTITPAYKLDVNGPINASALNVNGQPFIGSQWASAGSVISYMGKVGIGTPLSSNPNTYTLAVNGTIGARDVRVEKSSATWPDYVFDKNYNLPSIDEMERYIQEHKHLENVPSAKEVNETGYSMNEMDVILLKKVEELSLYIIQQQKQMDQQQKKIEALEKKLNRK